MNLDLLSGGLLAVFALLSGGLLAHLISRFPWKKHWRRLAYAAAIAILAAIAINVLVGVIDSTDKLPSDLWLVALPFTTSCGILALYSLKKRWLMSAIAGAAVLVSLLFGLAMLNDYYRMYPTLYSLLGIRDTSAINGQTVTLQYTQDQQGAKQANSIEQSLYGSNLSTKGQIVSVTIPGTISKFTGRQARAYIPAIAADNDKISLPVIVLMAGFPGSPNDWLNGGGVQATMDQFAATHHGITPIVFMVDELGNGFNDTECVDSQRGNAETYLSKDVPDYIKAHYNVSHDPSQWAIGGLSLGGLCGIMLTLRHTDTFHYFLDFGGDNAPTLGTEDKTVHTLFGGSQEAWRAHQPLLLLKQKDYSHSGIGGYFSIGKGDKLQLVNNMKTIYQASKDAGIESVIELADGDHTFGVWEQSYRDALPWISSRLGATQCTSNC
jgi:S-formylglutathione hydrolase FrmB